MMLDNTLACSSGVKKAVQFQPNVAADLFNVLQNGRGMEIGVLEFRNQQRAAQKIVVSAVAPFGHIVVAGRCSAGGG
jgi:hypothetical protein